MDTYLNFKAFQAAAVAGSFSRAARDLGLSISVVTKRINQLEQLLNVTLFERTTRRLTLTEAGRRYIERSRPLLADFDNLLTGPLRNPEDVGDFLRIKAPTSLTLMHLRRVFSDYQSKFARVRLEIVLMDRMVDPVREGFDVSIGAHWELSFASVIERPLCRLQRVLCASPDYLDKYGAPKHPSDLNQHICLSYIPTGNVWTFENHHGPIAIEVAPHLASNDGQLLVDAAVRGLGITIASIYMVRELVRTGRLIPLLSEYPVPTLWLKAVSPGRRSTAPAVNALMDCLEAYLSPEPPWER